ncbi:MAG: biotin--[acetyl-CoA-carboxylase] ligase [Pseudomonadota bacterium]|nr:biotin--[acetyl-CoA-carboxylase] ligase [Pseudomonadota bacterium]
MISWCLDSSQLLAFSCFRKRWSIRDLLDSLSISEDLLKYHLFRLIQAGADISVDGQIVCFGRPMMTYNVGQIQSALDLSFPTLSVFWSMPSTNDFCMSLDCPDALEFCLSEHQSFGRGRRNRRWYGSFADGILLSYRRKVPSAVNFSSYSLLLALLITEYVRSTWPNLPVQLKWPNDILLGGKKLMGILVERDYSSSEAILVVGLGCNVNRVGVSSSLEVDSAVGFLDHVSDLNKTFLAIELMKILRESLRMFLERGFECFVEKYDELHIFQGQEVRYFENNIAKTGRVDGVSACGRLRVISNGVCQLISSGSISKIRACCDT